MYVILDVIIKQNLKTGYSESTEKLTPKFNNYNNTRCKKNKSNHKIFRLKLQIDATEKNKNNRS